jgi:hypothetical protein
MDNHNSLYDHTGNQAQGYYLLLQPNASASSATVRQCEERDTDFSEVVSLFTAKCIESTAQFDHDQQSSMSRILVLHVRSKCWHAECAKSDGCLVSCTAMDQHRWQRLRMVSCTSQYSIVIAQSNIIRCRISSLSKLVSTSVVLLACDRRNLVFKQPWFDRYR